MFAGDSLRFILRGCYDAFQLLDFLLALFYLSFLDSACLLHVVVLLPQLRQLRGYIFALLRMQLLMR